MRDFPALLLLLLLLSSAATSATEDEQQTRFASGASFTIATTPLLPGDLGLKSQRELATKLEAAMQTRIKLIYLTSNCQILENAKKKRPDIMIIIARWAPLLVEKYGYRPLLKVDQTLTISIVSHRDNPIDSFAALRGKSFVPLPAGAATELILDRELDRDPSLRETISFHKIPPHKGIFSVINRQVDAAPVNAVLYSLLSPEFKNKLYAFDLESPIPMATILTHEGADPTLLQRYIDAMHNATLWHGIELSYSAITDKDILDLKQQFGDSALEDKMPDCS